MGIKVEFNPDLALRNISEFKAKRRLVEECIPENLIVGEIYDFLKSDQRNYWLEGEIPLLETKGGGDLSKPLAGIIIIEATHYASEGKIFTRGKYLVKEVFTDNKIHFNGFAKL